MWSRELRPEGSEQRDETAGILDCDTVRTFWVRWGLDLVEVGQGHRVGSMTLLGLRDLQAEVNITTIGVATDNSSSGEWQFNDIAGKITNPYNYVFLYEPWLKIVRCRLKLCDFLPEEFMQAKSCVASLRVQL